MSYDRAHWVSHVCEHLDMIIRCLQVHTLHGEQHGIGVQRMRAPGVEGYGLVLGSWQ